MTIFFKLFDSINFLYYYYIMTYNNNKCSYYTIVDFPDTNMNFGKYKGKSPKIAANKAFSTLINFIILDENNENDTFGKFIVFVIKDIDTNKEYKYIGNRIKLQNPITVNKNGKEITYKYKNIIGKYKKELDLI